MNKKGILFAGIPAAIIISSIILAIISAIGGISTGIAVTQGLKSIPPYILVIIGVLTIMILLRRR